MKAIRTAIGRVSTVLQALWKYNRKTRMTSETTTIPPAGFFQGLDGPLIRSERS
jgi:hypothetical protein